MRIIILILCVLPFSCAKRVFPTGGEGDIVAPKIISVIPSDKSVSVPRNQKITINFSEWINPKSVESGIMISPQMDFTLKIRGRTLEIKPKDLLKENTSYHLSFLSDISDYSNNLLVETQTVIFATGEYIDSGFIEGKVFFDRTDSAATPKIALFFDERANGRDSVLLSTPDYITQADSLGNFKFDNISDGKYRIIGFIDKNRINKIIPHAQIFISQEKTVSTQDFIELLPAKCDTVQNKIAALSAVSFNVLEAKLKFPSEEDPFKSVKIFDVKDESDISLDSIRKAEDNLTIVFFLKDSLQNQPYFIETKFQKIFVNDEDSIFCDTVRFNGTTLSDTLKLSKLDSLFLPKTDNEEDSDLKDSVSQDSVSVNVNADICPKLSWNYLGDLPQNPLWEIKSKNKSYITTQNFIENIPEGKYTISLTDDKNQNGRYDSGTLFPFVFGEKRILFPDTLNARDRWEVEYDINLDY